MTITNWLVDKIQGLFKSKETKEKDQIDMDIEEQTKAASKIDEKTRKARLDVTEEVVTRSLTKRGVSEERAKSISQKARKAAEARISKSEKHGTK